MMDRQNGGMKNQRSVSKLTEEISMSERVELNLKILSYLRSKIRGGEFSEEEMISLTKLLVLIVKSDLVSESDFESWAKHEYTDRKKIVEKLTSLIKKT